MGFRDAIAEPWGTRTPYGPGEQWPARVDQYLAEGVRAEDVQRWVRTASLLHSDGDAMDVAAVDGRMVGVRGRAATGSTAGRTGSARRRRTPWENVAPRRRGARSTPGVRGRGVASSILARRTPPSMGP